MVHRLELLLDGDLGGRSLHRCRKREDVRVVGPIGY